MYIHVKNQSYWLWYWIKLDWIKGDCCTLAEVYALLSPHLLQSCRTFHQFSFFKGTEQWESRRVAQHWKDKETPTDAFSENSTPHFTTVPGSLWAQPCCCFKLTSLHNPPAASWPSQGRLPEWRRTTQPSTSWDIPWRAQDMTLQTAPWNARSFEITSNFTSTHSSPPARPRRLQGGKAVIQTINEQDGVTYTLHQRRAFNTCCWVVFVALKAFLSVASYWGFVLFSGEHLGLSAVLKMTHVGFLSGW